MNELIEKWKPIMQFNFKSGNSVPEDKYQECAENLERIEKRYKEDSPNNTEYLPNVLAFCINCFADGEKFGGDITDFFNDHQEVLDQIDKSVQNFKEGKVFPIDTSS